MALVSCTCPNESNLFQCVVATCTIASASTSRHCQKAFFERTRDSIRAGYMTMTSLAAFYVPTHVFRVRRSTYGRSQLRTRQRSPLDARLQ